jgi:hypothetical protein
MTDSFQSVVRFVRGSIKLVGIVQYRRNESVNRLQIMLVDDDVREVEHVSHDLATDIRQVLEGA